jgi:fatty acid desaturase
MRLPASFPVQPRDPATFFAELDRIRREAEAATGPEDLAHLRRVEWAGRALTVSGFAVAALGHWAFGAVLIGLGRFARWTMIAHHVSHRAYDRIEGAPSRLTSKGFARGRRRFIDWLDWIHPAAWHHEHNLRHHPRTGEVEDPDLVERNADFLREQNVPDWARVVALAAIALTWKWTYYAPSTLLEMRTAEANRSGTAPYPLPTRTLGSLRPGTPFMNDVTLTCLLPYALVQFVLLPAPFALLGVEVWGSVLLASLLGELWSNAHAFAVIVPNHAGDDVYRFSERAHSREELLLRQIIGSVNLTTGTPFVDFMHGWLNYQIEHHLFPHMTMRQLQRIQPRVKALCAEHGVPYVQESVVRRFGKLVDIMFGRTSMLRA